MDNSFCSLSSTRSRASSIISTSTKTSITTLPQEEQHSNGIDVQLGRRNFRITARPGSILSISSFDDPAPPYDGPLETPFVDPSCTLPSTFPTPSPPTTPRLHTPSPTLTPRPSSPTTPTLTDPENALSRHYTNIVRTIDSNHHAELARLAASHEAEIANLTSQHAASLASTRHSIDQAYRLERKALERFLERSREESAADAALIEKTCRSSLEEATATHRQELAIQHEKFASLESQYQATILAMRAVAKAKDTEYDRSVQKARNEIEDLWEGRWKEWVQIAQAEAARERQKQSEEVKRALGKRDEAWVRAARERGPEEEVKKCKCKKQREAWAVEIRKSLNDGNVGEEEEE